MRSWPPAHSGMERDRAINNTPGVLRVILRAATRRIRLLRAVRLASRALCLSTLLGLLVVGGSRAFGFGTPSAQWMFGFVLGVTCLGGIGGFLRPVSELEAARLIERKAGLAECLSSAVEFQELGRT